MALESALSTKDWTSQPAPPPSTHDAPPPEKSKSTGLDAWNRQGAGDTVRWRERRSALVFVIDFRQGMIDAKSEGRPLLSHALRCAASVLKDKIISRARDLVGVIAFGCETSNNKLHLPHVSVLKELEIPDARSIIRLERMAENLEKGPNLSSSPEDKMAQETSQIGHLKDGPFPISNVLWVARNLFALSKSVGTRNALELVHRRVFLFTNDDDPSRGDEDITRLSVTQAKDLADTGAVLDLVCMTAAEDDSQTTKDSFRATRFYSQLIARTKTGGRPEGSIVVAPTSKFHELAARVRRRIHTKRAHASVFLNLGAGLKIGVKVYSLVRKSAKPAATKLAVATSLPAARQSSTICSETAVTLQDDQIRHGFKVGEAFASFSHKEMETMKRISRAGMTLYGFKSCNDLRCQENILAPLFVYPDDSTLAGSAALFACLHAKLLKMKQMAVVLSQLREKSSEPRFALLIPQEEEIDPDGAQLRPPGFHMVYLPYKNDLYDQWRTELEKAAAHSESLGGLPTEIDPSESGDQRIVPLGSLAAKDFVRELTIHDFDSSNYYHPEIQRHYAVLQAVALGHENFEEPKDSLQPDYEGMRKRAGTSLEQFARETLGPGFDGAAVAASGATKKRDAANDPEKQKRAAKRKAEADLKAEAAREDLDLDKFRDLAAQGELSKLKRTDLKQYCDAFSLSASGRKDALIARIEKHLSDTSHMK